MSDTHKPGTVYTKRHISTESRNHSKSISHKIRQAVEKLIDSSPTRSLSLDEVAELITGKDREFRKLYSALVKAFPEYGIALVYEMYLRHRARRYLVEARDPAGEKAFVGISSPPDENGDKETRFYVRRECSATMLENAVLDRVPTLEKTIESFIVMSEQAEYLETNKLASMVELSDEEYARVMAELRHNARRASEHNLLGMGYQMQPKLQSPKSA